MSAPSAATRRAFTLVELAVVVAGGLLALCVLSSLASVARVDSRAGICQQNTRRLTTALIGQADVKRAHPTSFVYGASQSGLGWRVEDQQASNPNVEFGNIHWSAFLDAEGWTTGDEVYRCPSVLRGGAPRTNPGAIAANWEPGQVNDFGANFPSIQPEDRQAARVAYTVNAAIMPRNLLNNFQRTAEFVALRKDFDPVPGWTLSDPSSTILVTEFAASPTVGWLSLATPENFIKSHRPLTPFLGVSSGLNVFLEPDLSGARYRYPDASEILPPSQLGQDLWNAGTELNAVGRHHAGGTAHFGHMDGSVRRDTVQATITARRWGTRFWSISGNDAVAP